MPAYPEPFPVNLLPVTADLAAFAAFGFHGGETKLLDPATWASVAANAVAAAAGAATATSAAAALTAAVAAYKVDPVELAGVPPYLDCHFSDKAAIRPSWFTRASTAWEFDAKGILQPAAINEPRIGFDPATGRLRGYRSEPQRTNLNQRSRELGNAWYTATGATVSSDAAGGPWGAATMDKIVESAANTSHYIVSSGMTVTAANADYTASCFVKAAGRTRGTLRYTNSGWASGVAVNFDLVAKTVTTSVIGNGAVTAADIIDSGGGLFLVWVSGKIDTTSGASTSGFLTLYNADAAGALSYLGDGVSGLHAEQLQLEDGVYPTSPIVTTNAQVTRSADSLSILLSDLPGYSAAEGSVYAAFTLNRPGNFSTTTPIEIGDGTFNNRIGLFINNANANGGFMAAGGATQASLTQGGGAAGARRKAAMAWAANDIAFAAGGAAQTDNAATIPAPLDRIGIGRNNVSVSGMMPMFVDRLTLFNRRLPNATVEALSA